MLDDLLIILFSGIVDGDTLGRILPNVLPASLVQRDEPPEFAAAYAHATEAIAADPANAAAFFARAVISQARGAYGDAFADLCEVLRREPESARAWLLLSEVLGSLGEYDRAREARARAVEMDSTLA